MFLRKNYVGPCSSHRLICSPMHFLTCSPCQAGSGGHGDFPQSQLAQTSGYPGGHFDTGGIFKVDFKVGDLIDLDHLLHRPLLLPISFSGCSVFRRCANQQVGACDTSAKHHFSLSVNAMVCLFFANVYGGVENYYADLGVTDT